MATNPNMRIDTGIVNGEGSSKSGNKEQKAMIANETPSTMLAMLLRNGKKNRCPKSAIVLTQLKIICLISTS